MVNDEILGTVILYVRQYKLYVLQNNTILCKQANKSSDFHLYKATKDKSEVKVGSFFFTQAAGGRVEAAENKVLKLEKKQLKRYRL